MPPILLFLLSAMDGAAIIKQAAVVIAINNFFTEFSTRSDLSVYFSKR
jgi:hypothetical protein